MLQFFNPPAMLLGLPRQLLFRGRVPVICQAVQKNQAVHRKNEKEKVERRKECSRSVKFPLYQKTGWLCLSFAVQFCIFIKAFAGSRGIYSPCPHSRRTQTPSLLCLTACIAQCPSLQTEIRLKCRTPFQMLYSLLLMRFWSAVLDASNAVYLFCISVWFLIFLRCRILKARRDTTKLPQSSYCL